MRTTVITESLASKRIDRALRQLFPNMPVSAIYKAFRKRDIKVNGSRVKEDYIVHEGDTVEIYITDIILDSVDSNKDVSPRKGFSVVFEDSNIIIVNKEQGISVQPEIGQEKVSLIELVKLYLTETGEFNPDDRNTFPPSLCHRLDRNTGGLVIISKNQRSLDTMLELIKMREIQKFYICYVKGRMSSKSAELKAYLFKDEKKSRVFINDNKIRGSQEIITRYRVLDYILEKDISKLEVELVTGRTHQIRAHLSHTGHPIIGDGKYGSNAINRPLGVKRQMLWAYKLIFDFNNGGNLNYLKGKELTVTPNLKLT